MPATLTFAMSVPPSQRLVGYQSQFRGDRHGIFYNKAIPPGVQEGIPISMGNAKKGSRRPSKCPSCKSEQVIPIVYGLPGLELFRQAGKGLIALGAWPSGEARGGGLQNAWGGKLFYVPKVFAHGEGLGEVCRRPVLRPADYTRRPRRCVLRGVRSELPLDGRMAGGV